MEINMVIRPKQRNIAYRCPECASAILGIVGKFALSANMLRLKCDCDKPSSLDISITNDGKIRLSVPCLFCKQNHNYVVSEAVFLTVKGFFSTVLTPEWILPSSVKRRI